MKNPKSYTAANTINEDTTLDREIGTVKFFTHRNWGFIEREKGPDAYLAGKDITSATYPKIIPGQKVEFTLKPRKGRGPQAISVIKLTKNKSSHTSIPMNRPFYKTTVPNSPGSIPFDPYRVACGGCGALVTTGYMICIYCGYTT